MGNRVIVIPIPQTPTQGSCLMRAIEEKMVAAIKQHKNLSGKNTRVVIDKENGEAKVFLFDNLIAVLDGCNRLTIGNCG